MKVFAMCVVLSGVAFVFTGFQVGLFEFGPPPEESEPVAQEIQPATTLPPSPKLRFPQDLAPTVRARAVPAAAKFDLAAQTYPMVFLKTNGTIYEKWQERLNEGWAAESVERTQLVVILGAPKKSFVDITRYPNGAPPIERFKHEIEVSVVEAHTGKVLANRLFVNLPRAIKPRESWELTRIGEPVAFKTVFNWVVSNARSNFPVPSSPDPIITVVE